MADNFDGMDPNFVNALQGLMGACGLSLTSGYRTHDEQARLYAQKPNLAAPPGRSNHERGTAADIAGDLDCAHRRAAEFGLRFPMDYEPWHIEPGDLDRSQTQDPPAPNDPLPSIAEAVFGSAVPSRAFAIDPAEMAADTQRRIDAGQDPHAAKVAAKQAGTSESASSGGIDAFMAAIRQVESGGNYDAHNPSGASGAYQIMPANWPSWAAEAGLPAGAPMTPENQDIVARFKMEQYYQQFGNWGDVATAWFAGPGAVGAAGAGSRSDGNTTVDGYVSKVLGIMGAGGGGGSTAVAATPAAAPTPQADLHDVLDTPGGGMVRPTKLRDSGGLA